MRVHAILGVLALGAVLIAGCSSTYIAGTPRELDTMQGTITSAAGPTYVAGPLTANAVAPDLTFKAASGKENRLYASLQQISVIAFVAPTSDCDKIDRRLADNTSMFWHLPVLLTQISEPTSTCAQGAGCRVVSGPGQRDVLALCDSARLAWNAYGRPDPGTVYLVDENNTILEVGTLDNMSSLLYRAELNGKRIANMHAGGWSGQY